MSDSYAGSSQSYPSGRKVRSMPQHADAEESVLSAMLLSEEARNECLVALEDESFYTPSNRMIYEAIHHLYERSMPVDVITLADYLESQGELEKIGGRERLMDLSYDSLAMASWRHHAEMLNRDLTLRRMIEASGHITELAFDAPEDTQEVVDKAEEMILSITDKNISSNYVSMEELMQDLYTQLGEQSGAQSDIMGIRTGYSDIDRLLLGLRPGQMMVVGARPAVGKTSFALNLAVNAAEGGATVIFFSLEMSSLEIAQRLLAARSGVDMQTIRSANIRDNQWHALLDATEQLAQLDILVDDTPGTTITEIRAKARRMLHGKKKGLIILDYLQLLNPSSRGRADSRATEVSEMSRGVKIMAKELGVPVVTLSQLSRANVKRTDTTPQLSDLRESGSIEQDADIVILMDRSITSEEAQKKDRPDEGVARFIVAKNRSGPTGTVDMMFAGASTRFMQMDSHHDE